jgi:hypothetical protein
MSIYLLPDSLINDIERMINAFWWGGGNNNKGIRWMAWDKMACSKEDVGLGFRDFHMFNMAMVAKQGWNLINKPNSLVAKILKARYFFQSSLLDSNLGNNPSFTWRSIWRSRQVLLYGCRWSIGDGSNIKVMGEPWLRQEDGRWVTSPQNQGVYDLSLQHLMLPNSNHWDGEKIKSLFSDQEAKNILVVPLLNVVTEDKLVWCEERDGIYSVRSGYRKLMGERRLINRPRGGDGWGCLWKIQATPKAKHLLWRICKECLPSRMKLRNRHVQCPMECPLCVGELEEEWHIFLDCEAIKEAWHSMGLQHIIQSRVNNCHDFCDLMFDICRNEAKQVAGKVAVMLWCIWQNRNNFVWNNNKMSAQQIGMQADHMWHEWAMAQGLLDEQQQEVQLLQVDSLELQQWQPPPLSYVKCNVDASFFNNDGGAGVFVIIEGVSCLPALISFKHILILWRERQWL